MLLLLQVVLQQECFAINKLNVLMMISLNFFLANMCIVFMIMLIRRDIKLRKAR